MILPRQLYDLLVMVAETTPVSRELLAALVQWESGWNPNAVGDQGHSRGLGQLHDQGAGADLTPGQAFDPETNLRRSAQYLRGALDRFGSDRAALSAYNQGYAGYAQRGELASQRAYLDGILALANTLRDEGIFPDDGAPAPPVPSLPGTTVTLELERQLAAQLYAALGAVL
jgi:soluble lytic murein transglycosylase-like protein